jgi:hypothetical protein
MASFNNNDWNPGWLEFAAQPDAQRRRLYADSFQAIREALKSAADRRCHRRQRCKRWFPQGRRPIQHKASLQLSCVPTNAQIVAPNIGSGHPNPIPVHRLADARLEEPSYLAVLFVVDFVRVFAIAISPS